MSRPLFFAFLTLRRGLRGFSIPRALGSLFGTAKDQRETARQLERLLREQLATLEADRDAWRTQALESTAYIREQNSRLLLKNGVMPVPDMSPRVTPPETPDVYDQARWEADDVVREIEQKAHEALNDPAMIAYYAEAALYDEQFKAIHDRITELNRVV